MDTAVPRIPKDGWGIPHKSTLSQPSRHVNFRRYLLAGPAHATRPRSLARSVRATPALARTYARSPVHAHLLQIVNFRPKVPKPREVPNALGENRLMLSRRAVLPHSKVPKCPKVALRTCILKVDDFDYRRLLFSLDCDFSLTNYILIRRDCYGKINKQGKSTTRHGAAHDQLRRPVQERTRPQ